MGIGLSGMISGLDTDSIVKAMVSAQQTKATKIENKITLNKWTSEAWSGLNTKIYSFYTKYASKLRLQSSYMTRTAASSNESIVKATAGSTAAVGTHTLKIKQLASSQYVTGAKVSQTADKYNRNTKLTELGTGVAAGTMITITGKKGSDAEETVKLEVTDKTTVNDFINSCKQAGLTASFDETQQRFFISSSQSGTDDAFSITTSALSAGAGNAFQAVESLVNASLLSDTEKKNYDAAMATLRQNTALLDDVLSNSYDSTNKEQKAVMDAINVVKDAAEKTAVNTKVLQEESDKLDAALSAAAADPSAKIQYGNTELTYATLETLVKARMEAELKKAAESAAGNAMKELATEVGDLGEGYVSVESLTAEKVEDAEELIAASADADGNPLYADLDAVNAALAAYDRDDLTEEETKEKEKLTELKNAFEVVNTWNYEVTDAETGAVNKVSELYATAYTEAYDTKKQADYPDYDAAVLEEMKTRLKAEEKTFYDEAIATRKAELLSGDDCDEAVQVKENINGALLAAAGAGEESKSDALNAMGLGEIDGSAVKNTDASGDSVGMVVVAAANTKIELDGATMEETSNNFTVNGITLNLASTTWNKDTQDYDTVQITVGKDTESTYNLVKEALTEYNKLIEEMNKLYDADSARGYDPLTDEQKEAMSETEIENWENKIKGSLLRRDDTLGSLLTSMRTALASSVKGEDGKNYSLSTYGIVTGNYTENGKLHIYGDTDDATYATYGDRLKSALEEDPDQVMSVLSEVFGNLYETMTEKCSAKEGISSALTFYNDKQYLKLRGDYEDDLELMEDRISALEDKYYKQFTAMETALSKLQSQSNSLASLLGTSTQG